MAVGTRKPASRRESARAGHECLCIKAINDGTYRCIAFVVQVGFAVFFDCNCLRWRQPNLNPKTLLVVRSDLQMTARLLARSSDDLSFACVNPCSFVGLACLLAAKELNRFVRAQGKCAEL